VSLYLLAPPQQYGLRGQTVKCFGYDQRHMVDYQFNDLGFRSIHLQPRASLITIGNSVTFGIGLPHTQTYASMLADYLALPNFNASFGCWSHENHDHLHNLNLLTQRPYDDVFVIQINNLDRRRIDDTVIRNNAADWCVEHLIDFWQTAQKLLQKKRCAWIYWDDIQYDIPACVRDHLAINNKGCIDASLPDRSATFGPKSHKLIFSVLAQRLTKKQ